MFPNPITFRFIDHLHEKGGGGALRLDKITSLYFYRRGIDCPNDSTLKISGAWVRAFDVSEPDVFSLHIRRYT